MNSVFRPLVLAIGLLSATAYADDSQAFSKVVIFGDSLSDTGRLKDTVTQVSPTFGNALQPSFTTNPDPVWASILANYYGKTAKPFTTNNQTGTNFAVGGARSGSEVNWNGVITVPSTSTQVSDYLNANNGKADPNALYAVWIGSNDLIAAALSADPQTAIREAVGKAANDIETLSQAGAKTILVPNIPDLSLTPRAIAAGTTAQAQSKLAATLYNQGLYAALGKSTANIIPANTFVLLQEAVNNKEAFGFSNTSGVACQMPARTTGADDPASTSLACTSTNFIEPNANNTYAFADDIHPAGKTHRILAQYYHSLIEAPTQIGQLTTQIASTHNNHRLYQKLTTLDSHAHSVWADVVKENNKTSTLVGLDVAGQNRHTGAYLSYKTNDHKVSTINADVKTTGVGLYHQHNVGQVRLTADIGIDKLTLDTNRQVAWDGMARSHMAKTSGRRFFAGAKVGYGLDFGKLGILPSVGIHTQKVRFDDIVENNSQLSTALSYSVPSYRSLQGAFGLDIKYPLTRQVDLTANLTHYHEFKDSTDTTVRAKLNSMPEYTKAYELPVTLKKQDGTQKADIGATAKLGNTTINAGVTATHTDGDSDVGGYAGVQMKF